MFVTIIYTKSGPFKIYADEHAANMEYKRLRDLDDDVYYSVISMKVIDTNNIKNRESEK